MYDHSRRCFLVCGGRFLAVLCILGPIQSSCWAQLFRYRPPESERHGYHDVATSLPVTNLRAEKAEAEIMAALAKTVSLEIETMPLNDFVVRFAGEAGFSVQIDHEALRDMSIPLSEPVSIRVSNVTLRYALDYVLRQHKLGWTIEDNVFMITTDDIADDIVTARVYPVRDLVAQGNMLPPDYDTLINVIVSTIKPDTWADTGGQGGIERFPNAHALVITQTREVHEQVGNLLAQLRKVQDLNDRRSIDPGSRNSPVDFSSNLDSTAPVRVYVPTAGNRLVRVHQ